MKIKVTPGQYLDAIVRIFETLNANVTTLSGPKYSLQDCEKLVNEIMEHMEQIDFTKEKPSKDSKKSAAKEINNPLKDFDFGKYPNGATWTLFSDYLKSKGITSHRKVAELVDDGIDKYFTRNENKKYFKIEDPNP